MDRHQDPSLLTVSRLFGAVPIGECIARARSPLLLAVPAWGNSHPLLLPGTGSAELSAPVAFPAVSPCATTTAGLWQLYPAYSGPQGEWMAVWKLRTDWNGEKCSLLFANISISQSSYSINSRQPRAFWALLHSSRLHTRSLLEGTLLEVTPWGWEVSFHSRFLEIVSMINFEILAKWYKALIVHK